MNYAIVLLLLWHQNVSAQLDGQFWWLNNAETTTAYTTTGSTTTEEINPTLEVKKLVDIETKPIDIICCECVSFYLCVNGTIKTDGAGILDLRFGNTNQEPVVNVKNCPGLDICCAPPDADPSCYDEAETETYLPPDTPCECQVYNRCPIENIVHDGFGTTTLKLDDGRLVSHSKCSHSLDVCCYSGSQPEVPAIEPELFCDCVEFYQCDDLGYIIDDGEGLICIVVTEM